MTAVVQILRKASCPRWFGRVPILGPWLARRALDRAPSVIRLSGRDGITWDGQAWVRPARLDPARIVPWASGRPMPGQALATRAISFRPRQTMMLLVLPPQAPPAPSPPARSDRSSR